MTRLSRRRFLEALVALVATSGLGSAACSRREHAAAPLLPDLDAAVRIGLRHLAEGADPTALRALDARIETTLAELDATRAPMEQLAVALAGWIREDFVQGRIVTVDGWQLARSEAGLCALLAEAGG